MRWLSTKYLLIFKQLSIMKKKFLLMSVLFLTVVLYSQEKSMVLTNNGVPVEKHVYLYDGANVVQDTVYFYSEASGSWVLTNRYHRLLYDNNGKYCRKYKLTYNAGNWDSTNVYKYSYDTDGNQLTMRNYSRSGSNWVAVEGYNHAYDIFGRMTSTIYVLWDTKYKFRLRKYSSYDDHKNHQSYKETYNKSTPTGGTDISNFDLMMALTENQISWYNSDSDTNWWFGYTQTFTYENNDKTQTQTRVSEKPVGTFTNKYKWERTFDDLNRIKSENQYSWVGTSSTTGSWSSTTDYDYVYTYYDNPNDIAKISDFPVQVYPGLVNDVLHINTNGLYEISIHDINGKKIYNSVNSDQSEINVKNFRKGVYIIKIVSKSITFNSKFIKL